MAKQFLLLIVAFLITASVKLQAQTFKIQAPPGYNYIYTDPQFPKGTEGSPYLGDWQPANILLKNGQTISDLKVRYNVLTNQMIYQFDNKMYIIGAPDSIAEMILANKTFIYEEYAKGNKAKSSFFEVVAKGKVNLLNKYEIELIRANYNVALDVGSKNDKLFLKQQLYLQQGDQVMEINKKSKFLEAFQDKNKEISSYMDKEGLSIKIKEDVIKILTYYDQLQ